MKNLKYFPFERNRYFYGKLLSVNDFEMEQKYFNDKRRMINRYLHGTGIVCGLDTVLIDDQTISVERGIALDFAGREIVVDEPVVTTLDAIEGYRKDEGAADKGVYYLCLQYEEQEKERIYSIINDQEHRGNAYESNRYRETYKLFLTNQSPERGMDNGYFCMRQRQTIFKGNNVMIYIEIPRFVKSGETINLRLLIENIGQYEMVQCGFCIEGSCLDGGGRVEFSFDGTKNDEKKKHICEVSVKVLDIKETQSELRIVGSSFHLTIGGREVRAFIKDSIEIINIVTDDLYPHIAKAYNSMAMDEIKKSSHQERLYLARIFVISTGSSYMIDGIEKVPFEQYVCNQELTASLMVELMEEISGLKKDVHLLEKRIGNTAADKKESEIFSYQMGEVIFDLGVGGKSGQLYYSEEISHGLGLGDIEIQLGICEETDAVKEVIYGDPSIFRRDQKGILASTAVRADTSKGTFVVGMKLLELTSTRFVKVQWHAVKKNIHQIVEKTEKKLMIKPDMANIAIGESVYFEAVLEGFYDERILWKVKEPQGGVINKNGLFVSGNIPGVYEILAKSTTYPEIVGSTFVMVREN